MLIVLVFALVLLFVGMWIAVLALFSQMSGWGKLAAVYRAQRPPSGRCFPIQGGNQSKASNKDVKLFQVRWRARLTFQRLLQNSWVQASSR